MKYSVIVPVYGTEKYLRTCVRSVLDQDESDFELILVDDCSPDGCPELCDSFATDDRVRVIHKEKNGGLGEARNTGLKAARGEYVVFADSDDCLFEELLSTCSAALDADTDILVFGIDCAYEGKHGKAPWDEKLLPDNADTARGDTLPDIFIMLNTERIFPFAWNKVYKRSFIEKNSLQFEKTELIEDFLFNIAAFSAEPSVKVIRDILYYYRRPAHETMVNGYSPRFFELCKRKYLLETAFLEKYSALNKSNRSFIAYSHIKHIISVAARNRSEKARLSVKDQKALIADMLKDSDTKRALSDFIPNGVKQRLIADGMMKENVAFVYVLGAVVDVVGEKATEFFKKYIRG